MCTRVGGCVERAGEGEEGKRTSAPNGTDTSRVAAREGDGAKRQKGRKKERERKRERERERERARRRETHACHDGGSIFSRCSNAIPKTISRNALYALPGARLRQDEPTKNG